jgi:hypothetical protein
LDADHASQLKADVGHLDIAMITKNGKWTEKVILILVTPLLLAWFALGLFLWALSLPVQLLYEWWLKYQFRQRHGRFGRFVLFIYSVPPAKRSRITVTSHFGSQVHLGSEND